METPRQDVEQALKRCADEPIHLPGTVQPHGVWIGADRNLIVRHVSTNASQFLGMSAEQLIGMPLHTLFGVAQVSALQSLPLQAEGGVPVHPVTLQLESGSGSVVLNGQVHQHDRLYIIELERRLPEDPSALFDDLFVPIRDTLWALDGKRNLHEYMTAVAEQVARLTGFDRVMVYQFDPHWNGEVIAEHCPDGMHAYLGHHFPAADIPPQARDLYLKNRLRIISDVAARPAPIYPPLNAATGLPVDMSHSVLRSFSPVHLEYLRNMGVAASMSISIVSNGRLWGLIACHHPTPLMLSYRIRELAEFVGKTVSMKVRDLQAEEKRERRVAADLVIEQLAAALRKVSADLETALLAHAAAVLKIGEASGALVSIDHRKFVLGKVPDIAALGAISDWVRRLAPSDLFCTDNLPESVPGIQVEGGAQGLLATPIDTDMANYVMWFRPVITKSIKWAGNPEKILVREGEQVRISPRKSFSAWIQEYSGHSAPWTVADCELLQSVSFRLLAIVAEQNVGSTERWARNALHGEDVAFVARLDEMGNYISVSEGCSGLLGYAAAEIVGQRWFDFLFADDQDSCLRQFANLLRGESVPRLLYRHSRKDGRYVWLEAEVRLLSPAGGGPLGVALVACDVTERQHYNETLEGLHRKHHQIALAQWESVVVLGKDGRVVSANEAANSLLGHAAKGLIGRVFCPEICSHVHCRGRRLSEIAYGQADFVAANGDLVPVSYWQVDLTDKGADSPGTVLVFHARRAAEADAGVGVFVTDRNGRFEAVNEVFSRITGYGTAEAIGRTPALIRSNVHTKAFYTHFWQQLSQNGVWRGEIWNRRKNGEVYPQLVNINSIESLGGERAGYLAVFSDVSKATRNDEKAHRMPGNDPLTGLMGRMAFAREANRVLAKPAQQGAALAFIDLNNFKGLNDVLGHVTADRLLYQIANRLGETARTADILARWGGDKFVVLLTAVLSEAEARIAIERLLDGFSQPILVAHREIKPTASVGVALFPRNGATAEALMQAADTALNHAKLQGESVCFFQDEFVESSRRKFELVNDLRHGIAAGQLFLVYQPQIAAATGCAVGLEALVRWRHPVRGVVPPVEFIEVAEEHGLIEQLGAEVFRMACAQIQRWRAQGAFNVPVGINVAPQQLKAGFPEFVANLIHEADIPPELIEIEITESALKPTPEIRALMNQLKAFGLSLAIDDFGTGYSSLSHLKLFPFDRLKIDKSFIDGVPANSDDIAISQAIIALGQALKTNVLAEGVERPEQEDFLRAEGVDVIQGYLHSKPILPEEIPAFIASHPAGRP